MNKAFDYSEIAPYQDHEVNKVLDELKSNTSFLHLLKFMKLDTSPDAVDRFLAGITSVDEFQLRVSKPWLHQLFYHTTTGIIHKGIDTLPGTEKYLFISNHRDIALDSAILNVLFSDHDIQTVETAIGDNLLKFEIVKTLAKLNKNFKVKRSGSAREMYRHSLTLSSYIRKRITEQESSIWIAQREGRAKDGNDKTQQGVIKMLNLSNENGFEAGCKALNIRPISMSYEYDPCDRFKVKELLARETNDIYEKEEGEDFNNVIAGFLGHKGRVNLSISPVLDCEIDQLEGIKNINEKINELAKMIDLAIYQGYQLFPNNYIAHDILQKTCQWHQFYSRDEKQAFTDYANNVCRNLPPRAKEIFFQKYAYPLINKNREARSEKTDG